MFSSPSKNIDQLNILPGMCVVDFGAGSGAYVIEAGFRLHGAGKVIAVDILKDLLLKLKREADANKLSLIETLWADLDRLESTPIKKDSVDRVIVSNILFQLKNKDAIAIEAKRILKSGGKILIVDWKDSFKGMGPDKSEIFSEKDALKLFEKHSFVLDKKIDAGDHHWGIIFTRN